MGSKKGDGWINFNIGEEARRVLNTLTSSLGNNQPDALRRLLLGDEEALAALETIIDNQLVKGKAPEAEEAPDPTETEDVSGKES